jgi:hypothetical protein
MRAPSLGVGGGSSQPSVRNTMLQKKLMKMYLQTCNLDFLLFNLLMKSSSLDLKAEEIVSLGLKKHFDESLIQAASK